MGGLGQTSKESDSEGRQEGKQGKSQPGGKIDGTDEFLWEKMPMS